MDKICFQYRIFATKSCVKVGDYYVLWILNYYIARYGDFENTEFVAYVVLDSPKFIPYQTPKNAKVRQIGKWDERGEYLGETWIIEFPIETLDTYLWFYDSKEFRNQKVMYLIAGALIGLIGGWMLQRYYGTKQVKQIASIIKEEISEIKSSKRKRGKKK